MNEFDAVEHDGSCEKCGEAMTEWQTPTRDGCDGVVRLEDAQTLFGVCAECGAEHTYTRKPAQGIGDFELVLQPPIETAAPP